MVGIQGKETAVGTQGRDQARRKHIAVTLLLVPALVAAACAGESDSSSAESHFLQELAREEYPEADPPAMPPMLRWDFSNTEVHAYAFEQQVRNQFDIQTAFEGESGDGEQSLLAKGSLLIKSQGDGTANLVLEDVKMSMKMHLGEEEKPGTMEQTIPPVVVQGMNEDGSGSFGCSSQDVLLQLLFPLPTKPLKVGEFVDVPAQMPFNVWGSLLQVEGRSRITLTRYVRIGKRTCAQLDVDIDISDLNVPSELEGEYGCSAKGASVFYFDVAGRRFVSGTVAVLMQITVDAPLPKMSIPGEEVPDMPERSKMSMAGDNLIRVSLKE